MPYFSIMRIIDANPDRQATIADVCHCAANSGTIIVTENVETQAQADTLRGLGVSLSRGGLLGQGYYFATPTQLV